MNAINSFRAQLDVPGSVAAPFRYSQQQPRLCAHSHSQRMASSAQQKTYVSMTVTTLGDYPTPSASIHLASASEKKTSADTIAEPHNLGTAVP